MTDADSPSAAASTGGNGEPATGADADRTTQPRAATDPTSDPATPPLWRPGGIFWRTFFLIALLIGASLLVWFQSFRVLEREPRAQQAAQTLVSVVNVTRSALIHSDAAKRRDLLIDLASNEGIRIYPQEETDKVAPLPDFAYLRSIETWVRSKLGPDTQLSLRVNGQAGLWVDFAIDEDRYWVSFDRDRVDSAFGLRWLGWGAVALVMSLAGAIVISRLINLPLKRLTAAAVTLGRGRRPAALPDSGPHEIREANASFNAMVEELERIESDRALLLAGISHDLRTPLTRLRLEIEMSGSDEDTRHAMSQDIDQMDAIIAQFLDYARPASDHTAFQVLDLAPLVRDALPAQPVGLRLATDIAAVPPVRGHATELTRLTTNLIENARRYGRHEDGSAPRVTVRVYASADAVAIEVADDGPGVARDQLERLKRPFTRANSARSEASGAGLGLAIVERIVTRHGGRLELESDVGRGFTARVFLPVHKGAKLTDE